MAEERLQKILARAGYGSRRASEELIAAGRVRINGAIAELGEKADPQRDTITVDQQPIAKAQAPVYIALHKPQGILSEVSPEEQRETVRDLVPVPGHMFIVGRLDLESEGLILLTNDGELANRLTHPRYGHEKEYRVLVGARPDAEQLEAWRRGIVLEDGHRTAPAEVRIEGISGKGAWLRVILHEGRKRQIREMGRLTGLPVFRIIRIRIGSLELGELKPGQWRELRPDEVRALRSGRPVRLAPRAPRAGTEKTRAPLSRRSGEGSYRAQEETHTYSSSGREEAPRRRGGPGSGTGRSQRSGGSARAGASDRREDTPSRTGGAGRTGGPSRTGGPGRSSSRPARPGGTARPSGRPGSTGAGRTKPGGRPERPGSPVKRGPARGGPKRSNRKDE